MSKSKLEKAATQNKFVRYFTVYGAFYPNPWPKWLQRVFK